MTADYVTVTISRSTLVLALNCLEACAGDQREPERYRQWYTEARDELALSANDGSEARP